MLSQLCEDLYNRIQDNSVGDIQYNVEVRPLHNVHITTYHFYGSLVKPSYTT